MRCSTQEYRTFISQTVNALKRCGKMGDLEAGKELHRATRDSNCDTNRYVAAALINMYSSCGCVDLAKQIFDGMISKNVVIWNSLIMGYVDNGQSLTALRLFDSMTIEPSSVTYIIAIKACRNLGNSSEAEKQVALSKGACMHKQIRDRGLESTQPVANALVSMYSELGLFSSAKEVFERMQKKDVIAWTALIQGYVEHGECSLGLELFSRMHCEPDFLSYVAALKACGGLAAERASEKELCLRKGAALHRDILERGFQSNILVANGILGMYGKCGAMELAREVFNTIITKDAVSWNTLILGYVENEENRQALNVFTSMLTGVDCQPDPFTFAAALKACKGLAPERLDEGIHIHKLIKDHGYESDIVVATSLVEFYSRYGRMNDAREVFDRINRKDVVSWTSMLLGYVENGEHSAAFDLFTNMDCKPNSVTYTGALKAVAGLASSLKGSDLQCCLARVVSIHKDMRTYGLHSDTVLLNTLLRTYMKCGSMSRARETFDRMINKDVVTWNTLIQGYAENGEFLEALGLFTSMDCPANSFTFVAALRACRSLTALQTGRYIHSIACKAGMDEEEVVAAALMDFYGKCSNMNRAEELFGRVSSPDTVSWNSLIAGYSSCGDLTRVFNSVKGMQEAGHRMDDVTFVCVLTACNHAGLVVKGKHCFESMLECVVSPRLEHYNCMVDMLGRANRIQEALALVNSMPFVADAVTWRTLLGACRKWKNLEVGKVAFDALVTAGLDDASAYVSMRDIYGSECIVKRV